jgi:hypothetical protein
LLNYGLLLLNNFNATIEADCQTGQEIYEGNADQDATSARLVGSFDVPLEDGAGFAKSYTIELRGSVKDPRTPALFTPAVDHNGTITVFHGWVRNGTSSGDVELVSVSYNGNIDEFPAFEMYVQVDNHPPQLLFSQAPPVGLSNERLLASLFQNPLYTNSDLIAVSATVLFSTKPLN